MSDWDECVHGIATITCSICNGRDAREAAASADAPRVFPAKYDGHCGVCNLPIHAGQMIAWRPDERPTHEECAS